MYNSASVHKNDAGDGGGVWVADGNFTMYGGEIFGNIANTMGGGVTVESSGTFRMVTGTIYGSAGSTPSPPGGYANTTGNGAALNTDGSPASYGTFSGPGGAWVSNGNFATTNNTIKYKDGAIVPTFGSVGLCRLPSNLRYITINMETIR